MKTKHPQSIGIRLLKLSLIFAIPFTAIVIYQITSGINKNITFTRQEMEGNSYQRALEALLEKIPLYGIGSKNGQDSELKYAIDRNFEELDKVQSDLGDDLSVTPAGFKEAGQDPILPATLRSKWQQVRDLGSGGAAGDREKKLNDLTSDLGSLIAYIGTTSNLILDPEMDSYFLGDFTLNKMPQTQTRLATLIQKTTDAAPADVASRQDLAVDTAMLEQDDLNPALSDISTCLNNNGPKIHGISPTLRATLPSALQAYKSANDALLQDLKQWVVGPAMPAAPLAPLAAKARSESFKVWEIAVHELDVLLQRRIESLQNERLLQLLLTLLTLGGASVVAWRIAGGATRELKTLSDNLSSSSTELASASAMLSSTSQTIATGANEQAAALQETSASLEQITSMGKLNASSAASARVKAGETRVAAEEGARRTQEMQASMEGIKEASEEMGEAILGIKESSNNVSKIIKTIDEIAFQTNILALNAAVEAARAGEAGAGFAVVADEVRNLAQRSAAAAKETAQMIESSVQQSTRGVIVNEKVANRLREIIGYSKVVQENLSNIVTKVRQVDDLVLTISDGTKEESIGLQQIALAVNQMDLATQAASAVADQTASTSEEIAGQANALLAEIGVLKTLVTGQTPPPPPQDERKTSSLNGRAKPANQHLTFHKNATQVA